MKVARTLSARALRYPSALPDWTLHEWETLIRQARRAGLLARLAWLAQQSGGWERIPPQPRAHLEAAQTIAQSQAMAVQRELFFLRQALDPLGVPIILLKGAAYLAAQLPPAHGRLFSDIDLLVPESAIGEVETALMLRGWASGHHDPHDQRYYRKWMHEIPPLRHIKRMSVVDVHHAILPLTARIKTPSGPLIKAAIPLPDDPLFCILSPPDMVLHSATHLFHEGEFGRGLRDLTDLDALLRHFGQHAAFWDALVERARLLNLTRPLNYALRYCRQVFDTPIPALPEDARPTFPRLMDALFERALAPEHASCNDSFTPFARGLLYIRSHWLRMPPWLLLRHLFHKAFISPKDNAA